jgi:hypothetical protein
VYGVAPPLGVKGDKLVIAVPTVRLCAVVVAVAVMEILPLDAGEAGDGKEEGVPPPPPPPHAATSRLKTTTLARLALKAAGLRCTSNTFGFLRKIILEVLQKS